MMECAKYELAKTWPNGLKTATSIITLKPMPSKPGLVSVARSAFDWMREHYGPGVFVLPTDCDYALGAVQGARYALSNTTVTSVGAGILITEIKCFDCSHYIGIPAVAAAHAAWDLLQDTGVNHPVIDSNLRVDWPTSPQLLELIPGIPPPPED